MKEFPFKRSFTLIELLVVVAIIGILASLLMPSLQKAREKGKRAVCLSNQHQVFLSMTMYEDDFGTLPPGNATIHPGFGIDSTYNVSGNRHMGLAILNREDYMEGGGAYYCPSWIHPDKNYGVIDTDGSDIAFGPNKFGGWPKDEINDPWPTVHVGISYHYRSTFNGNEPAQSAYYDSANTAIMADMWTRREALLGQKYGHYDAYATLFLDGHGMLIYDTKGNYMRAKQPGSTMTHQNWGFQETVWQDFFDD